MGKWLKRIADTPLETFSKVIDSLDVSTDDRTNAPSIHAVREAVNNNWLSIYPVGSIYMSVNNVNPSTIFGGTWEQIKDRFLLACGDTYANGAIGGEATHTLTVNEIPSHTHLWALPLTDSKYFNNIGSSGDSCPFTNARDEQTGASGGGQAHNNMPPYLAVNVWVRTA